MVRDSFCLAKTNVKHDCRGGRSSFLSSGPSYVTGKAMIDELNGAGMTPVSLIHWQLTGQRR